MDCLKYHTKKTSILTRSVVKFDLFATTSDDTSENNLSVGQELGILTRILFAINLTFGYFA